MLFKKSPHQFFMYFPAFFILGFIGFGEDLYAQSIQNIQKHCKGMVVNAENDDFLMGVHIYAKSAHKGAVSDQKGIFELEVMENDTLIVTFVGFKRQVIPLNYFREDIVELVISIKSETIELPGITIFGEPNIDYLKRPERTVMRIPGVQAPAAKPDVDVPVGSLSYGVLSRWGKEAKEKRKLMDVYSEDRREIIYTQTVSSDSVRSIFMYQYDINEKQYNDFIIFFNTYKPLMDRQDPEDIVRVMHQTFLKYKPMR